MKETVDYLCSPACLPRNPGTAGGIAARTYLRDRLNAVDLQPAGEHGFDQHIPAIGGSNLLGIIPGQGDRYVLLAAHYDACGDNNPGADDNAAAVAIALTVAQQLQGHPLDRSVIIALFDAEEPPYFLGSTMGSQWFVDHPTVPLDRIDMMICLDLVGHALGPEGMPPEVRKSVFVLGAEKSTGTGMLMDELPDWKGIQPRRIDNYIISSMSDYDAFMNAEIPFLFYTVGRSEHYHASTDTPDRLDYPKMAGLANHLTDLIVAMANRPDHPTYIQDGYDDASTIASATAVIEPLVGLSPEAGMAKTLLDGLATKVTESGHLDDADRSMIQMIVADLESSLG